MQILCKVAAEAVPRVAVNIALAIGALCSVRIKMLFKILVCINSGEYNRNAIAENLTDTSGFTCPVNHMLCLTRTSHGLTNNF